MFSSDVQGYWYIRGASEPNQSDGFWPNQSDGFWHNQSDGFWPKQMTILTNFDPTRVMGLTNGFDSGEFFVGLIFDTIYYSELW